MQYINGTDRSQTELLPDSIEDYVNEDNSVRAIDAFINSLNITELGFEKAVPDSMGRPPYDPRDLLKLYIYGYMNRIRSSRRLENESKRNLELMWLMRRLSPDHKTIARFRSANAKALKSVFRVFVKLCSDIGLYGKKVVAVDGSKFKAVNSKERNFTVPKLKDRLSRIDEKIDKYLDEMDKNDRDEDGEDNGKPPPDMKKIIDDLKNRRGVYQNILDELEKTGQTQISLTDPDSRLMPNNGKMDVCYNVQTAVDSEYKLIAEFEVTNHPEDFNRLHSMTKKTVDILETNDIAMAADKGYNSANDIIAAVKEGVDVHVSGADFDACITTTEVQAQEITKHNNGRCVYFDDRNIVVCPMGKALYPKFYKKKSKEKQAAGVTVFSNSEACGNCACKCSFAKGGKRHEVTMKEEKFSKEYDDKHLYVRQVKIKADKDIYNLRKSVAEHPFGTIKRNMDASYCLTKGISKVTGEFSLVFLAYNFKRVINILGSVKLTEFCMA